MDSLPALFLELRLKLNLLLLCIINKILEMFNALPVVLQDLQHHNRKKKQHTLLSAKNCPLMPLTGDWGLGTGDWGLGTGDRGLGTGDWGLGTGDWGLGTGDWGLGTGDWGLGTGDWGLGTGPGPQARLAKSWIESKLSCLCFWVWDGFSTKTSALRCWKPDEQMNSSFAVFKLMQIDGSEIEMKNLTNPG